MNKIAQILNNKVHWIFETNETLAEVQKRFAPDCMFVDITGLNYSEGWDWDSETQTASDPTEDPLNVNEQIASLDAKYSALLKANDLSYIIALRKNNTDLITELNTERADLENAYATKLAAITE